VAATDALPYKVDNDRRDRVEMDFGLDEVGRIGEERNGPRGPKGLLSSSSLFFLIASLLLFILLNSFGDKKGGVLGRFKNMILI
jgi:hypothetical protein